MGDTRLHDFSSGVCGIFRLFHGRLPGFCSMRSQQGQSWRVRQIEFSCNKQFAADELSAVIVTKERPWYRFWG